MSEWCLSCLNKLDDTNLKESDVKISNGTTLCEGCGEHKNIVLGYSRKYKLKQLPFKKIIKRILIAILIIFLLGIQVFSLYNNYANQKLIISEIKHLKNSNNSLYDELSDIKSDIPSTDEISVQLYDLESKINDLENSISDIQTAVDFIDLKLHY